jgi:hypothetical protein
MKKWLVRVIVAGLLAAVGLWGWRVFFPSPEEMIRKRLGEVAKAASSSAKEGLLAKAWNASALGEFFTLDVQITIDVSGTQHTINGRDELMQAVVGARSEGGSLSIEFPDIKVDVAPDGNSAVVNLTAKAKVSRPQETYFQELRVRMTRTKRDWLINQIETVKTLSFNHRERRLGQVCSVGMRTMELHCDVRREVRQGRISAHRSLFGKEMASEGSRRRDDFEILL